MKKVEAIIRPERLDEVKSCLENEGFVSMTISDVEGRGRQKGIALEARVGTYQIDLLPKIKVELMIEEEDVDRAIDIICEAARTGEFGDGKIVVYPLAEVCRVRTGERGAAAL